MTLTPKTIARIYLADPPISEAYNNFKRFKKEVNKTNDNILIDSFNRIEKKLLQNKMWVELTKHLDKKSK